MLSRIDLHKSRKIHATVHSKFRLQLRIPTKSHTVENQPHKVEKSRIAAAHYKKSEKVEQKSKKSKKSKNQPVRLRLPLPCSSAASSSAASSDSSTASPVAPFSPSVSPASPPPSSSLSSSVSPAGGSYFMSQGNSAGRHERPF